ncbi:MAG: AAA family ATPase [Tepidisphaeraceae bacterium]|jgi:uridine kinase
MPPFHRILITGASGCGSSTLGRALRCRLGYAFIDTDDLFWHATTPPYQHKRDRAERLALALDALSKNPTIVMAGSICGWGEQLERAFDLVVFLTVPTEIRLKRLERREARRGLHDPEFFAWAASYDIGATEGRNRQMHEQWLAALQCPVLRLDGQRRIADLVSEIATLSCDKQLPRPGR